MSLWDSVKLLDIVCGRLPDPVSKAKLYENMAQNFLRWSSEDSMIEETCGLLLIEIFLKAFLSKTALWNGLSADTMIYCEDLLRTTLRKCCFALVTLIFSHFAYKFIQNSIFESTFFITCSTYFRHVLYSMFQFLSLYYYRLKFIEMKRAIVNYSFAESFACMPMRI